MNLGALEQYRDLKTEIAALEDRMEKLDRSKGEMVADTVVGSTPGNSRKHVILIRGYPDGAKIQKRVMQLEAIRMNRIAKLLDLEVEIEEYIDSVEDSQVRQIIGWRYLDGWGWRKIARRMGHPKSDEQYPRRIIERHFEKCTNCTKNTC